MFFTRFLIAGSILWLLADGALAQANRLTFGHIEQDASLPIEVTADQLDVDQTNGTAVFTGDVLIGQGDLRLAAPKVTVIYRAENDGIERLEAEGGVTIISGPDAAESETADYNVDDGTIIMIGDVLLTQELNTLTADKMIVYIESGTAEMVGRVRTILQTGQD